MRDEQALVNDFMVQRPVMLENNRNKASMVRLFLAEAEELVVELEAEDVEKIAQELPDVIWFCLTIANLYGIDMENAFWAKAIRNEHKYPEENFDGSMTYEEAATLCRALWAENGNDNHFTPDKI